MYLCPPLKLHFDDDNGNPLSYGTLSTYVAGSSVPVQTYADAAGSVLNEAVMTLNERGEVSVFLDPSTAYKFVLKRADGSNVYTTDYVTVLGGGGSSGGVSLTSSDSSVKLAKTIVNGVTIWNLSVAEYVTAAVGTETTRAEAVEAVLGDRITQETTDRTTADTALGDRITAEEAARIAADDTLQSNINAETTRAEAAEASARTEVVQGSNITVNKSTGADGHDIYTVTGVESVPKVEIVSTDASIGVTSSTDAGTNTKTFDLSVAAETKAKNFFIGSTTLAALSDATETTIPFARSAGDLSVSSGTVTIPGTVKLVNLSLRVNIGYTGSATNIDYKKFVVKLYINEVSTGSWDYYADASAPAFESGSVLSHVSLLSLSASTAKTIRLTITNTDAAADFEYQAQLDLNDETFRSLGGGGSAESDHKVSVDGTDTAGYLFDKVISADESITLSKTTGSAKVNFAAHYPGAGAVTMAASLSYSACSTWNQFSNSINGSGYSGIFNAVQPFGNLRISSTSKVRAIRQYNTWDHAKMALYHWDKASGLLRLCGYSALYEAHAKTGLLEIPFAKIVDSTGAETSELTLVGGDFYYVELIVKSYTMCPLLGSTLSSPYYGMPRSQFVINVESTIINNSTDVIPNTTVDYTTLAETDQTSAAWVQVVA